MKTHMHKADYEDDASIATVRRKLYRRKEEQDVIDPPDMEDDLRTSIFRSHSEPASAPATYTIRRRRLSYTPIMNV
jgi:hypothetical protein